MKTLLLIRHAKAKPGTSSPSDFERSLDEQGRIAAGLIGSFIQEDKLEPDLLLSSPAIRARETIEIVKKKARLSAELRLDQRIYEAGSLRLLEVISQIEDDKDSVVLVGHNPGLEELLQALTDRVERMNTGAIAKISFSTTKWRKTLENKGNLDWLVRPKDLEKDK